MFGRSWVLAFDGECAGCTRIARVVAEESGERIRAVSLSDPSVAEWRESTGHSDTWRPLLFRVDHESVRAYTGFSMTLRLGFLLGPLKAARVIGAVAQATTPSSGSEDLSRRGFLRISSKAAAGVVAGAALLGIRRPALALPNQDGTGRQLEELALAKSEVKVLGAKYRSDTDGAALQEYLVEQGYSPRWDESFGMTDHEGSTTLVVPFESEHDPGLGAGIVFRQDKTGKTLLQPEAGIFRWRPENESTVSGTWENSAGSGSGSGSDSRGFTPVVLGEYKVQEGEIVEANSWWSCFWQCLSITCGPGAWQCRWTGPFWWTCVKAVCGGAAIFCAYVCRND